MSRGRGTRLPQVLVFAEVWPQVQIHSDQMELRHVAGSVPSPPELTDADAVLIMGPVKDAQYSLELAGAMKLALERGATFVFMYNTRLQELDQRFHELVQFSARQISGSPLAVATKPMPHPAFREYLPYTARRTFSSIISRRGWRYSLTPLSAFSHIRQS